MPRSAFAEEKCAMDCTDERHDKSRVESRAKRNVQVEHFGDRRAKRVNT